MRSTHQSSALLLLFTVLYSVQWEPSSAIAMRPSKSQTAPLQPWEHHVDPNPFPSIAEIEETTTMEDIDAILDQITGKEGGIIIQQYRPQGSWLWGQFYGTVIYSAWPRALFNMAYATAFCAVVEYQTHGNLDIFHLGVLPEGDHSLIASFVIVEKMWSVLMSLTTFLLTFFVSQSWSYFQRFLDVSRTIQGRFNSIQMLLSSHAVRGEETGTYTPEAEAFLRDMAMRMKLFHTLYWSSQALRFRALLTQKGWDGMVERGLLAEEERQRLQALKISPTQKHIGVYQSMMVKCRNGIRDPNICVDSDLLEDKVMSELQTLRGTSGTIADLVAGRMPLAYVHFVEVLVDSFLLCAPIAKYSDLGVFSVPMIGILTFFYHGLLILAKVFMDPLDNEQYKEGCVYVDLAVLLRESNAGIDKFIDAAETI